MKPLKDLTKPLVTPKPSPAAGAILLVIFSLFFLFALTYLPPMGTLLSLAALSIFIFTFIDVRVGLAAMVFGIALSPKLRLGPLYNLRVEDLILVVCLFAWLARLAIKRGRLTRTGLEAPFIAWLSVSLIATVVGHFNGTANLLSLDPHCSGLLFFLKRAECFVLFLFVANNIQEKKDLKFFLVIILLSSLSLVIFTVQQKFSPDAPTRLTGPTGEGPNTLGVVLVFYLGLALSLFLFFPQLMVKVWLASLIASCLYAILFTLSRTAWAQLLIMIVLFGFLKDHKILLILILLLVLFTSAPHLVPTPIAQRTLTWDEIIHPLEHDTSYSARVVASLHSLKEWLSNPLIGFGLGSVTLGHIDSDYVKELYYCGLLGFAAFAWLLFVIYKTSWHVLQQARREKDPVLKGFALGFFVSYISYLAIATLSLPFSAIRTAEIFWFTAAMTVALKRILEPQRGEAGWS